MELYGSRSRSFTISVVFISLVFAIVIIGFYQYESDDIKLYNKIKKMNENDPKSIWPSGSSLQKIANDIVKRIKFQKTGGCLYPPLKTIYDFFNYAKKEKYNCKNLVEVGGKNGQKGIAYGSKFMCFDEVVPGDCTVLSFGINNEWSYDDEVYKLGCTVYAFDPTMGVEDFDRTPGIHFFNLGLSDFKGDKKIGKGFYKVDRYENILRMLNLTDKKIDYLKIDIEGSEIEFFIDAFKYTPWIFHNVKQMGVEIHPGRANKNPFDLHSPNNFFFKYWGIMHQIECHGYKLLHHEPNRVGRNPYKIGNQMESSCYEIVWIKIKLN